MTRPSDEEIDRLVQPFTLSPVAWSEHAPAEAIRVILRTAIENDRNSHSDRVGTSWRSHFEALFRAVAACEPPEGTQLDEVLTEFQSTYDEIQESQS